MKRSHLRVELGGVVQDRTGELANVSLPGFTPAINYCFKVHIPLAEACYNISDVQCVLLEWIGSLTCGCFLQWHNRWSTFVSRFCAIKFCVHVDFVMHFECLSTAWAVSSIWILKLTLMARQCVSFVWELGIYHFLGRLLGWRGYAYSGFCVSHVNLLGNDSLREMYNLFPMRMMLDNGNWVALSCDHPRVTCSLIIQNVEYFLESWGCRASPINNVHIVVDMFFKAPTEIASYLKSCRIFVVLRILCGCESVP
jgi:hypothetical protein